MLFVFIYSYFGMDIFYPLLLVFGMEFTYCFFKKENLYLIDIINYVKKDFYE